MRILHVVPQLVVGGAERIVSDLIRVQAETDAPYLCVTGRRGSSLPPYAPHAEAFLGFSGSFRDGRGMMRCFVDLRRLVGQLRPDVLHAHLWPAALFAAAVATERGIGCVVHVHDSLPWLASTRLACHVHRCMYRNLFDAASARVIAVSHAVKEYTTRHLPWPADRIRVIHNGVDAARFQRRCRRRNRVVTIGSVGRLEIEKGFEHLVRAAAILRDRAVEFRLLIAGDGSQARALECLATKHGLGGIATLVGIVEDIRSYYEGLDVFVLPSISSEGLPMSILEAMSMELPIAATAIAGTAEAVRHGTDGLLVSAADSTALADALQQLIEDDGLRIRMGASARGRVTSSFTHERMAERVKHIYEEMV